MKLAASVVWSAASALLLSALFACRASGNTNLITNGSFEAGDFNNNDSDSRPEIMRLFAGATSITGWTVAGGTLGVDWLDRSLGGSVDPSAVSDGSRAVDLVGSNPPGQFAALETSFPSVVGEQYHLTFDAISGANPMQVNSGTVSVDSLVNQAFTGGAPHDPPYTYLSYGFDFTATSSLSTLAFQASNSDGFGPIIDNVVVTVIPEPASLAFLGISGVALLRRRSLHSKWTS